MKPIEVVSRACELFGQIKDLALEHRRLEGDGDDCEVIDRKIVRERNGLQKTRTELDDIRQHLAAAYLHVGRPALHDAISSASSLAVDLELMVTPPTEGIGLEVSERFRREGRLPYHAIEDFLDGASDQQKACAAVLDALHAAEHGRRIHGDPVDPLATYTVAQAAEFLQISADQVRSLIEKKKLAATNLGAGNQRSTWIVTRQSLDEFLSPAREAQPIKRKPPKLTRDRF